MSCGKAKSDAPAHARDAVVAGGRAWRRLPSWARRVSVARRVGETAAKAAAAGARRADEVRNSSTEARRRLAVSGPQTASAKGLPQLRGERPRGGRVAAAAASRSCSACTLAPSARASCSPSRDSGASPRRTDIRRAAALPAFYSRPAHGLRARATRLEPLRGGALGASRRRGGLTAWTSGTRVRILARSSRPSLDASPRPWRRRTSRRRSRRRGERPRR